MNSNKWFFKDGASVMECESFPFAFRLMFNTFRKGLEKNARKADDMIKQFSIVSPVKDAYGKKRVYSYAAASQMAKNSGLLTPEGTINSKEFKNRY